MQREIGDGFHIISTNLMNFGKQQHLMIFPLSTVTAPGSEKRYNEAANMYQQIRHGWTQEPRVRALRELFVKQCP